MAKDYIKPYIVQIQCRLGNGSGVLVKDDNGKYYIFTAKHNFKSTDNQKVEEIEIEDIKEDIHKFNKIKVISYHEIEVYDVIGLDDLSIDFVILVVSENSFEYLNKLLIEPLKIYNDSFKECIVSGYPKISTDAIYLDCKYETKNKEYEKKDDYKHTFKVSSIYPLNQSGVTEVNTISGISGGGIFVKGEDEKIHLIAIEIEYIDIHNLVCVSLKDVIDEINTKLDIPIQLASSDGLKPDNKIDTTVKEYYLTIECIPKNEKFEVSILHNNRMKKIEDKETYTKNEIAHLVDNYIKQNKPTHIHNGSVFLLFVLPISLMSENIGNWKVGEDKLADKYTIMLRGQERFRNRNKHLYAPLSDWKNDWDNCEKKENEKIKNIIYKKYDIDDNSISSQKMEKCPLIVFGYNIQTETFEKLYRAGVSKAIWVGKDAKFKTFKELFKKKKYKNIEFGQLHNNLCEFKEKEKKIGSHIMFLYDDPNNLPLDDSDMAQINPI